MILLDVRREHSIEDCSTPNEKLNAPVEIPPFENRKGWGSLTKINFSKGGPASDFQRVGDPDPGYHGFCCLLFNSAG